MQTGSDTNVSRKYFLYMAHLQIKRMALIQIIEELSR